MALRNTASMHYARGNRLVMGPAVEPITLTELKTHMRISDDTDNQYLAQLIQDTVQELEDYSGLALITQSWQLTLDRWPLHNEQWWDGEREAHIDVIYAGSKHRSLELPRYPLRTVDAVTVYDESDNATVVTIADVFDIDTSHLRGTLTLKRGAVWPTALRASAAIEIDYTAGYGGTTVTVPAPLRRAVRQMAAFMYEHRGDGCDPGDALSKSGAKAILDRYRVVEV